MLSKSHRIRVAAIICSATVSVCCAAQPNVPKIANETLRVFAISSRTKPGPDFAKVRAALLEQTEVPARLPTFLPFIDAENPVAASLVSTSSPSYEIALGWGKDCFSPELRDGAGACHYGTIRGSVEPLVENNGQRIPITLTRGIDGYFVGFTCGAHCSDPAIGWEEDGYHYSISLKAGSRKILIRVANSAIAQQHNNISMRKQ